MFATTIALVAVVGASLVRFPFGSSSASEPGAGAAAVSSATLAGNTASEPASPAAAPGPSPEPSTHEIEIVTRPEGARVELTPVAGTAPGITGTSPLTATISEGTVDVRVSLDGHETRTQRVDVTRDRRFKWWLDPEGTLHHKVTQFKTGAAPEQVTFNPQGTQLWVSLLGGPGVEVYRPDTGERLAMIGLRGQGAVDVIFTADGTTAYASQMETGSVYEIDAATFEVRRRLRTEGRWSKAMALSPDGRRLFVSNWSSNDVSEIDLDSGGVMRTIPTVATPRGLYITADDLYVAGFAGGDLERIARDSGKTTTLAVTGGAMHHVVGDARRQRLYASDMGSDRIFVHDLGGDRVRRLTRTDHKPGTIDLGADGRVLYVANRGANNPDGHHLPGPEWGSVLAIDTRTGEALDAIVGGNQTTGLDVSASGRLLAFSDALDDRVQVYEIPPYDDLADGDGGRAGAHRRDLVK
jgi:YVTN family beta-propeller protein